MTRVTEEAYASAIDARDPLAHFRERFVVTEPDLIYMDGNSLGRLPCDTAIKAEDLITRQWGTRLIRSWNEGWYTAPERIGAKIARLIGAQADEVIIADSTSINLFKLVVAALRAQRGRLRIYCRERSTCWISSSGWRFCAQSMAFTVLSLNCKASWMSRSRWLSSPIPPSRAGTCTICQR